MPICGRMVASGAGWLTPCVISSGDDATACADIRVVVTGAACDETIARAPDPLRAAVPSVAVALATMRSVTISGASARSAFEITGSMAGCAGLAGACGFGETCVCSASACDIRAFGDAMAGASCDGLNAISKGTDLLASRPCEGMAPVFNSAISADDAVSAGAAIVVSEGCVFACGGNGLACWTLSACTVETTAARALGADLAISDCCFSAGASGAWSVLRSRAVCTISSLSVADVLFASASTVSASVTGASISSPCGISPALASGVASCFTVGPSTNAAKSRISPSLRRFPAVVSAWPAFGAAAAEGVPTPDCSGIWCM